MLAQRTAPVRAFTRRDAGRFTVAAALLVVALAAILSIDILPTQVDLGVGQVATTDVRAPRAAEYVSAIQTAAARQAAREKVEPQYDYTADKGATLAAQQARAFEQRVAPVDAAFDASLKPAERTAVLQSAVDGLSDKARATLV
ncbi:MAG TPA: hypothetical protein VEY67_12500, partial [Candidatus Dormibacteraeota bacterium]|nr:hypothetical protein [Candidatus Dormibacteraeota bacterium]